MGARDAAFEEFDAGNVVGFLELAGVNTEVAVGGFEDALEIVETERFVGGESADDAEADPLVNEAIEFGEFGSLGWVVIVGTRRVVGMLVGVMVLAR